MEPSEVTKTTGDPLTPTNQITSKPPLIITKSPSQPVSVHDKSVFKFQSKVPGSFPEPLKVIKPTKVIKTSPLNTPVDVDFSITPVPTTVPQLPSSKSPVDNSYVVNTNSNSNAIIPKESRHLANIHSTIESIETNTKAVKSDDISASEILKRISSTVPQPNSKKVSSVLAKQQQCIAKSTVKFKEEHIKVTCTESFQETKQTLSSKKFDLSKHRLIAKRADTRTSDTSKEQIIRNKNNTASYSTVHKDENEDGQIKTDGHSLVEQTGANTSHPNARTIDSKQGVEKPITKATTTKKPINNYGNELELIDSTINASGNKQPIDRVIDNSDDGPTRVDSNNEKVPVDKQPISDKSYNKRNQNITSTISSPMSNNHPCTKVTDRLTPILIDKLNVTKSTGSPESEKNCSAIPISTDRLTTILNDTLLKDEQVQSNTIVEDGTFTDSTEPAAAVPLQEQQVENHNTFCSPSSDDFSSSTVSMKLSKPSLQQNPKPLLIAREFNTTCSTPPCDDPKKSSALDEKPDIVPTTQSNTTGGELEHHSCSIDLHKSSKPPVQTATEQKKFPPDTLNLPTNQVCNTQKLAVAQNKSEQPTLLPSISTSRNNVLETVQIISKQQTLSSKPIQSLYNVSQKIKNLDTGALKQQKSSSTTLNLPSNNVQQTDKPDTVETTSKQQMLSSNTPSLPSNNVQQTQKSDTVQTISKQQTLSSNTPNLPSNNVQQTQKPDAVETTSKQQTLSANTASLPSNNLPQIQKPDTVQTTSKQQTLSSITPSLPSNNLSQTQKPDTVQTTSKQQTLSSITPSNNVQQTQKPDTVSLLSKQQKLSSKTPTTALNIVQQTKNIVPVQTTSKQQTFLSNTITTPSNNANQSQKPDAMTSQQHTLSSDAQITSSNNVLQIQKPETVLPSVDNQVNSVQQIQKPETIQTTSQLPSISSNPLTLPLEKVKQVIRLPSNTSSLPAKSVNPNQNFYAVQTAPNQQKTNATISNIQLVKRVDTSPIPSTNSTTNSSSFYAHTIPGKNVQLLIRKQGASGDSTQPKQNNILLKLQTLDASQLSLKHQQNLKLSTQIGGIGAMNIPVGNKPNNNIHHQTTLSPNQVVQLTSRHLQPIQSRPTNLQFPVVSIPPPPVTPTSFATSIKFVSRPPHEATTTTTTPSQQLYSPQLTPMNQRVIKMLRPISEQGSARASGLQPYRRADTYIFSTTSPIISQNQNPSPDDLPMIKEYKSLAPTTAAKPPVSVNPRTSNTAINLTDTAPESTDLLDTSTADPTMKWSNASLQANSSPAMTVQRPTQAVSLSVKRKAFIDLTEDDTEDDGPAASSTDSPGSPSSNTPSNQAKNNLLFQTIQKVKERTGLPAETIPSPCITPQQKEDQPQSIVRCPPPPRKVTEQPRKSIDKPRQHVDLSPKVTIPPRQVIDIPRKVIDPTRQNIDSQRQTIAVTSIAQPGQKIVLDFIDIRRQEQHRKERTRQTIDQPRQITDQPRQRINQARQINEQPRQAIDLTQQRIHLPSLQPPVTDKVNSTPRTLTLDRLSQQRISSLDFNRMLPDACVDHLRSLYMCLLNERQKQKQFMEQNMQKWRHNITHATRSTAPKKNNNVKKSPTPSEKLIEKFSLKVRRSTSLRSPLSSSSSRKRPILSSSIPKRSTPPVISKQTEQKVERRRTFQQVLHFFKQRKKLKRIPPPRRKHVPKSPSSTSLKLITPLPKTSPSTAMSSSQSLSITVPIASSSATMTSSHNALRDDKNTMLLKETGGFRGSVYSIDSSDDDLGMLFPTKTSTRTRHAPRKLSNPKDPYYYTSTDDVALQRALTLSIKTANEERKKIGGGRPSASRIKEHYENLLSPSSSKKKKREVEQLVDTYWNESWLKDVLPEGEEITSPLSYREERALHYAMARFAEMENKSPSDSTSSTPTSSSFPSTSKQWMDAVVDEVNNSATTGAKRKSLDTDDVTDGRKRRRRRKGKNVQRGNMGEKATSERRKKGMAILKKAKENVAKAKEKRFETKTASIVLEKIPLNKINFNRKRTEKYEGTYEKHSGKTKKRNQQSQPQPSTSSTIDAGVQKKEYLLVPKYKGFKDFTPIVVGGRTRRSATAEDRDKLKKHDFPLMVVEKVGDQTNEVIVAEGEDKSQKMAEATKKMQKRYELLSKKKRYLAVSRHTGETILHKAARLGYADIAEHGISREGADVQAKDNAGWTALHEACAYGKRDVAEVLLRYGADPNCSSKSGIRPLHDAAEKGNISVIRLLLAYGADPNIGTYTGALPIDCTRNKQIKEFLREHENDQSIVKSNDSKNPAGNGELSYVFGRKFLSAVFLERWQFSGSCDITETCDVSGIFENIPPPTNQLNTVEFQMSAKPLVNSVYLPCTDPHGTVTGYKNYFYLSELLERMSCSRNAFFKHHKVESVTMKLSKLKSEMTCNMFIGHIPKHLLPPLPPPSIKSSSETPCSSKSEEVDFDEDVELVSIGHYSLRKMMNFKMCRVDL